MIDRTIVHRPSRDGTLKMHYTGMTTRPDIDSDPTSLHHPVLLGTRTSDGAQVALHLDSPQLVARFAEARPRSGDTILAGRTDLVATRPDVLDPEERDPGLAHGGKDSVLESDEDRILLHLAAERYTAEHPGPVAEHTVTAEESRLLKAFKHTYGRADPRPAAERGARPTARRAAPGLPGMNLANPGSIDLAQEESYVSGLTDGLLGLDPARAALERWQASLGSGNPGAEMVRTR